ncbi:DUF5665 domain-containing protein [Pacificibacter sp. AS14]|uniref:DUF5665 domain-containing protein n=1 Tax=Pacificibacter sp. AS14 TaxID=3135785 RepID=UPI00317D551E
MSDSLKTPSNDIKKLSQELARLNGHRFIQLHDSVWRLMWFNFLRGLAFGFGSVAGATIVVSIVGYILNQIEVVPIIGEWAKQIAAEIMIDTSSAGP